MQTVRPKLVVRRGHVAISLWKDGGVWIGAGVMWTRKVRYFHVWCDYAGETHEQYWMDGVPRMGARGR